MSPVINFVRAAQALHDGSMKVNGGVETAKRVYKSGAIMTEFNKTLKNGISIKQTKISYPTGETAAKTIKKNPNGDVFESIVTKGQNTQILKNGNIVKRFREIRNSSIIENGNRKTVVLESKKNLDGSGFKAKVSNNSVKKEEIAPNSPEMDLAMRIARYDFQSLS